jgi:hypothetical protein
MLCFSDRESALPLSGLSSAPMGIASRNPDARQRPQDDAVILARTPADRQ